MIDKRSHYVLKKINETSKDGEFVIISINEIREEAKNKYQFDIKAIKDIVKDLSEKEFISLKFMDDKSICVSSAPRGRQYDEVGKLEEVKVTREKRYMLLSLLTSLIGGFLGAMIAILIFG